MPLNPADIHSEEILEKIIRTRTFLHAAGSLSEAALRALLKHCPPRIRRSAETGCGTSTLLLSHLSEHHTVFSLDAGNSISNVRRSSLLGPGVVSFVEGPSQATLPSYRFDEKLQFVLIDGPHAYPFPDLEYYLLYPQLDTGGLLVLDDIHIRSINNLFQFLRSDEMFRLVEVVRTTAFFVRTDSATFDPLGDNWNLQRYNSKTLFRRDWRAVLKRFTPEGFLRGVQRLFSHKSQSPYRHACSLSIMSPKNNETVGRNGIVRGRASLVPGSHLWILVHRKDIAGWWPQNGGPVHVDDGNWTAVVKFGEVVDIGHEFEVAAVIVTDELNEAWMTWVISSQRLGPVPSVQLPNSPDIIRDAYQIVRLLSDAKD